MDKQLRFRRARWAAAWSGALLALAACGGGGGAGAPMAGPGTTEGPVGATAPAPAAGSLAPAPTTSPVTSQQQVNTTDAAEQNQPSVAQLAGGGHVIAWASTPRSLQDPHPYRVCWRIYGADSAPTGDETCIERPSVSGSSATAVAALAGGGFLVAWHEIDESGNLDLLSVRADAGGQPVSTAQRVHAAGGGYQADLGAAGLAGGGAVVVWRDNDPQAIVVQRYAADGNPLGGETRVDSGAAGSRFFPVVAALADGGFVVAWNAQQGTTLGTAVYVRRYLPDGTAAGPETLVSDPAVTSTFPRAAGLAGGGFVVGWNHGTEAAVQPFAADGSPQGGRTTLDPEWLQTAPDTCYRPYATSCPPYQVLGALAGTSDGGFVAAWGNNSGLSLSRGLFGRRFDAAGAALGPATQLVPPAFGQVALAATAQAGFVLTWAGSDSDGGGILMRRHDGQALR